MYIWVILILMVAIYGMCLDGKLDNKFKELDIRENEIKKQLDELLNDFN